MPTLTDMSCLRISGMSHYPRPGTRGHPLAPRPRPRSSPQDAARRCPSRLERRLRGRHARDRQPERRAAHVVEPGAMEERDRVGVAAVLAADRRARAAARAARPRSTAMLDERADAVLVDRSRTASGRGCRGRGRAGRSGLDVVAREAERGLREVVGAEREELGVRVRCSPATKHARGSSIIVPTRKSSPRAQPSSAATRTHQLARLLELAARRRRAGS